MSAGLEETRAGEEHRPTRDDPTDRVTDTLPRAALELFVGPGGVAELRQHACTEAALLVRVDLDPIDGADATPIGVDAPDEHHARTAPRCAGRRPNQTERNLAAGSEVLRRRGRDDERRDRHCEQATQRAPHRRSSSSPTRAATMRPSSA